MSIYKASIYNYFFNSINAIIVIINGVVMVPVYFHYMSVSTYGAWLATGNMVAMLGLLESGFSSVITQKMAAAIGSGDKERYGKLAGANIVTAILIAFGILFLGLCIAPFITNWINVEEAVSSEIRLSYIIALFASSAFLITSSMMMISAPKPVAVPVGIEPVIRQFLHLNEFQYDRAHFPIACVGY